MLIETEQDYLNLKPGQVIECIKNYQNLANFKPYCVIGNRFEVISLIEYQDFRSEKRWELKPLQDFYPWGTQPMNGDLRSIRPINPKCIIGYFRIIEMPAFIFSRLDLINES